MDLTIETYVILVKRGKIKLEDVPIEHQEQVKLAVEQE